MFYFFSYFLLFSFLLNFVWEVTQIPLYRSQGLGDYSNLWWAIKVRWRVSVGDSITTFVAYALVGFIFGNWQWFKEWNIGWALFIGGLIMWQVGMEYVSVYRMKRWAYAPTMPQIFGIGLSPLLQMIVMPLISLSLASAFFTSI